MWEIVFTSGTTAMPKGAMVSHNYTYLGAYSFALRSPAGCGSSATSKLVHASCR